MAAVSTRAKTELYLLGQPITELCGNKLPSRGDVLRLLLHFHLHKKQTTRQSAALVIDQVSKFWDKAKIPMRQNYHCITKLEKLHAEWFAIKKHKTRKSKRQEQIVSNFVEGVNNLFDIAHADALSIIKIQEDRDFLLAQREPGRKGSIGSVDEVQAKLEKRRLQRSSALQARHQQAQEEKEMASASAVLSTSSDDDDIAGPSTEHSESSPPCTPAKKSRGMVNIVSPSVSAALDRTNTSDRKAAYILTATAQTLGHDVDELALNRSTIKRQRERHRSEKAKALKEEFCADVPLVVHWDGKLMADLTGSDHVDRLSVLVSGNGVSQLLSVAKTAGTGEGQATSVCNALEGWNLQERVVGLSFDTTSSNTGPYSGACVLIEQKLNKGLLYFACRHHILELIAGAAFTTLLGPTWGPEVPLFKRFKQQWDFLDQSTYSSGVEHDLVDPIRDDIIHFAENQLANHQPRDDYQELLELSIIFLGGIPPRGISFRTPGPMHHARWMSKIIYALKVWLFRDQFKLTSREKTGLRAFCVFAVSQYIKSWFTAPLAACAPRHDLQLLKDLHGYSHPNLAKATSSKLRNHLWYLSEELVSLAFFDREVPVATKREMVKSLVEREGEQEPLKRITVPPRLVSESSLQDFVTQNSRGVFNKLGIQDEFLKHDPETWTNREDYIKGEELINSLCVTNDHAERAVALVQEFNRCLTHDEEQLQFLLQAVTDHRRKFPDCRKATLAATS